jgi:hypothetical protein
LAAIDYEEVALDVPVLEFGLDSLVAIELKNWLTRTFNTSNIETGEILGMPSIDALAVMVAERSSLVKNATSACRREGRSARPQLRMLQANEEVTKTSST